MVREVGNNKFPVSYISNTSRDELPVKHTVMETSKHGHYSGYHGYVLVFFLGWWQSAEEEKKRNVTCHSWVASWQFQCASAVLWASLSSGWSLATSRSLATWPHTFQKLAFRNINNQTKNLSYSLSFAKGTACRTEKKFRMHKKLTRHSGQHCRVYPENRCRSPSPFPPELSQATSGLSCWCTANRHGLSGLKGS